MRSRFNNTKGQVKYDLLYIMGQSNADGRGSYPTLQKYHEPNPNALITYYRTDALSANPFPLKKINIRDNIGVLHGVELSFAYRYSENPLIIIKNTEGGQDIAAWSPGQTKHVRLLAQISHVFSNYNIGSIFNYWNQGESSITRTDYVALYKAIVSSMENAQGRQMTKHAIARLPINSTYYTADPVAGNAFRARQQELIDFYNAYLLDQDSYPLFDGVHMGTDEEIDKGNKLFDFFKGQG